MQSLRPLKNRMLTHGGSVAGQSTATLTGTVVDPRLLRVALKLKF
jgi:hypothetical protein